MAQAACCPGCQAELPADAPRGLCPECLLRQVVTGHDDTDEPAPARTPPGVFVPPAPAELAWRFPQLEILGLLGQGGMGAVYKARQTKLDRLVAVKVLPPEVARDPAFAERFTREARALARLHHSHIVTVHDFGDVDGLYYFSMEYVDGQSLRERMQAGPLPAVQVLGIARQLCDALEYAHDEGLVHRDIKPENILLDRKGRVKIADFGLAKLVGLTPAYLTLTGSHEIMGTLLYMAPEQLVRSRTVDHRADLYSVGVVLYEMLTGELPLGRFAPPSHKAGIEPIDPVVLRALAREPADRYQDAASLKQEVERALAAAGQPGYGSEVRSGPRPAPSGSASWPSARFYVPHPHNSGKDHALARGLLRRDQRALVLDFDTAPKSVFKKFKAFFKQEGEPQEVRIPLNDIASLSYGWGWGKPPRSLLLRVARLAVLAGMPGSEFGEVKLMIPRRERTAAQQLVESLAADGAQTGAPALVEASFDRARARALVTAPAIGLMLSGVFALASWGMLVGLVFANAAVPTWVIPLVICVADVFAAVLIAGGVRMWQRRSYPFVAAAAILAMLPWSPAWLIGIPFGIWSCMVLGKPEVADAFFNDERPRERASTAPPQPPGRVIGPLRSFFRSIGRYMLPSMPRPEQSREPG